jgi:hypothetical protein
MDKHAFSEKLATILVEVSEKSQLFSSLYPIDLADVVKHVSQLLISICFADNSSVNIFTKERSEGSATLLGRLWNSFVFCSNSSVRQAGYAFMSVLCTKFGSGIEEPLNLIAE